VALGRAFITVLQPGSRSTGPSYLPERREGPRAVRGTRPGRRPPACGTSPRLVFEQQPFFRNILNRWWWRRAPWRLSLLSHVQTRRCAGAGALPGRGAGRCCWRFLGVSIVPADRRALRDVFEWCLCAWGSTTGIGTRMTCPTWHLHPCPSPYGGPHHLHARAARVSWRGGDNGRPPRAGPSSPGSFCR